MFNMATDIVREAYKMTIATAALLAERLVSREAQRSGTNESAYDALKRRYGLTRTQLRNLKDGRAKTVSVPLFEKLRTAYLDSCQRQMRALEHEIAMLKASGEDDAFIFDLESKVEDLVATLDKARGRSRRG